MFGIGLPEILLILAIGLIVIGPDKLPDLARSLAKGLLEIKKTTDSLKHSFSEEGNPLNDIRPDLEEAAKSLQQNLLDNQTLPINDLISTDTKNTTMNAVDAYQELIGQSLKGSAPDEVKSFPESLENIAPTKAAGNSDVIDKTS